jgi:hypothetical protein
MNENLTAYLNDHLAGSVAALELIDDLTNASEDASLKQFLTELKRDIVSDQKVLEQLIDSADEKQSVGRKAAAWLSEKAARAKFKIAGEDFGGLGLVQALEMLALGIRGKELLWRSFSQSGDTAPSDARPPEAWQGRIDLAKLQQRAREQQQRVEERRLEAAKAAFRW